jgi:DNA polymerase-3 subunit epsilon
MRDWLSGLLRRVRGTVSARGGHDSVTRWIVLDVETSGLDPSADRVLAVGAVAVHADRDRARIVLADSLELFVAQPAPSERENILVHGIGEAAQRDGVEPALASGVLRDYLGDSPLVAYHASFDRGFLSRALKAWSGDALPNAWIDAAELAPALHPEVGGRALDDWLAHFAIPLDQRHNACADALATAMLFVRLLAEVPAGERDLRGLQTIASHARWLPQA